MTELNTHSKFAITNVSRRGLLKGVAATGGGRVIVDRPCCLSIERGPAGARDLVTTRAMRALVLRGPPMSNLS